MGWALLGLVLGIPLGFLLAAGLYFSNMVRLMPVKPVEETYQIEVEAGVLDPEAFEQLPKEEVRIPSPFGYELYGLYIPVSGARKTVIIAHGITYTLYGSVKYMEVFRKLGYNVLVYDHRRHGRSGGTDTSYGYYEKYDLKACVDWVIARNGPDTLIGTHGESLGAATALQHAALDARVHFVVADCSFASAREIFAYRLHQDFKLPAFPLIHVASLINKMRGGWFFGEANPLEDVPRIKAALLFIHGAEDAFVPPHHSECLYARATAPIKRLWLAPQAGHAEALFKQPEAYAEQVKRFLDAVEQAFFINQKEKEVYHETSQTHDDRRTLCLSQGNV